MKPKRILVLGLDGAIPTLMKKYIEEDLLPNIRRFIEDGAFYEAYPCPPCDTPTNWTTIATGAPTGVHGATSFYMHIPGEPFELGLEMRSRSQLAAYCKAEYMWDVADRMGMPTLILNYPVGWGDNLRNGSIILLSWPTPTSKPCSIAPPKTYSLSTRRIDNPPDMKSHSPILEIKVPMEGGFIRRPKTQRVFLVDSEGRGYDTIVVETNEGMCVSGLDEWSEWLRIKLDTSHGLLECMVKLKLVEASEDGSNVRVIRSEILNVRGWTIPEEIGEKLILNSLIHAEPMLEEVPYVIFGKEKDRIVAYVREAKSIVKICRYLKSRMDWRICFLHFHIFDDLNHRYAAFHEGILSGDEENVEEAVRQGYKIADEFVGDMLENVADEDDVVMIVSDHGAVPASRVVNIALILMDAGLLAYKWNGRTYTVDWNRTLAFPYMEPPFIWVNLEGRDPTGIVKPSEYNSVVDMIIDVLSSVRDERGERPFSLILRRDDAAFMGLKGDRIGDVIYFLNPPYELFDGDISVLNTSKISPELIVKGKIYDATRVFGAHAYYLPSTRTGKYMIPSVFAMMGPGIRRLGYVKRPIYLTDVTPTIAHLLSIPKPRDSTGRVLYESIE
ncbi:hypothetical protein DRO37_06540 [Candidatus Bathyarchaeota archaeon]|nr:MAG: hypothetical protein DRO37_06540 [Candidatus Bathyarchaeota archaeon]